MANKTVFMFVKQESGAYQWDVAYWRRNGHSMAIFWYLKKNVELIMEKIQSRNKKRLLYGDWNLNFMVNNKRLQELQNLLESYNMMNTVWSPTRITPSTESVIDVIITNKDIPVLSAAVVALGLSDHLAQIVRILVKEIGELKPLWEDGSHTILFKNLNIYYLRNYGMMHIIA